MFFPPSLPFNFFWIWAWGSAILFRLLFLDFSFLFEYFPLWRRFRNFCFTHNLLSWLFRWVSSFKSFFPLCLIIRVHYRGNKVWLTTIFLFRIIIWIIWRNRDTFEAFLRCKFSKNTNYNSLTVRFSNKVGRGWRIGLHVGISKSNLENAVLDRRRFLHYKETNWTVLLILVLQKSS